MHAPGTHAPEAGPFAALSIQAGAASALPCPAVAGSEHIYLALLQSASDQLAIRAAEYLEACGATGLHRCDYRTRELTRALQTYIGLRTGGAA